MDSMTLTGMLPGSRIESLDTLKTLPAGSVVLRRSHTQPYFRTAWTLTVLDAETRYWASSSWRAQPSDEDLFEGAMETMILLYRPREEFAVGLLDGNGRLQRAAPMTHPGTLDDAKGSFQGSPPPTRCRRSSTGSTRVPGRFTKATEPSSWLRTPPAHRLLPGALSRLQRKAG